jgi:hypothetical protein
MKLSKKVYDHIFTALALADESWRDNEDTQKYLPKSEEAIKWLKAAWDKQEKRKLKKLRDLKPGEGSSKLQDPKKKLEEWYAKNNVKIGI